MVTTKMKNEFFFGGEMMKFLVIILVFSCFLVASVEVFAQSSNDYHNQQRLQEFNANQGMQNNLDSMKRNNAPNWSIRNQDQAIRGMQDLHMHNEQRRLFEQNLQNSIQN